MGTFVVTTLTLIVLLFGVYKVKADECGRSNATNCFSCVEKGVNCYWCPDSGTCAEWDWINLPDCKQKYFYKQCDVNGLGFIVAFSIALFLLVVVIVSCCICCCCYCKRRGRRREYESMSHGERDGRNDRNDTVQHAHVHVRRIEIRRNYGATTDTSTAENLPSSLP